MPKKIGLEIGTKKTKIVVGNYNRSKLKITGHEIIDTVDGVFSIDKDTDILKMEFPIKEALGRLSVKSGQLYVSINNEKVIIRTRELPRVSKKEMMDIVRFEAENFLPYDISEFFIDFKVLNEVLEESLNEEEKETLFNVMIIAAPKDIVNQYIELAKNLKLKLKLATVYTEAVNRFVEERYLEEDKNILFVDIGDTYTNMTMYEGTQYFANIKTDLGISTIKEKLVDTHGFSRDDVEYQMFSKSSNGSEKIIAKPKDRLDILKSSVSKESFSTDNKLHNLQKKLEKIKKIKSSMDAPETEILLKRNSEYETIIKEISRMVEFFKSRKYGTYVDYIYVFGGGSYLSDFVDLLIDDVGVETNLLPNTSYEDVLDNEVFELMIPTIGACIGGRS